MFELLEGSISSLYCCRNQARLQRNLMYLAAIADSQPQPPTMHGQVQTSFLFLTYPLRSFIFDLLLIWAFLLRFCGETWNWTHVWCLAYEIRVLLILDLLLQPFSPHNIFVFLKMSDKLAIFLLNCVFYQLCYIFVELYILSCVFLYITEFIPDSCSLRNHYGQFSFLKLTCTSFHHYIHCFSNNCKIVAYKALGDS